MLTLVPLLQTILMTIFLSIPHQTVPSTSVDPLSYLSCCCETKFQMSVVDVDTVISILTSLDSAKATGYDGLSVKFLKACPHAMAKPLTRVINQSILSCTFPDSWKSVIVTQVRSQRVI